MVGFGFKPRQLGLSGSQHRAANHCAGRPLSHYRPLLQSMWAPHVMEECIRVHIFCVLWVFFVSLFPSLGTWYLSDLSLGNTWETRAFLSFLSARGCLPWSASLARVPSRPECLLTLSLRPPAHHIPPLLFSPLLSAHWPTLVPVPRFTPLLRNLRSLFSLAVEHGHLGSPHFLLLNLHP